MKQTLAFALLTLAGLQVSSAASQNYIITVDPDSAVSTYEPGYNGKGRATTSYSTSAPSIVGFFPLDAGDTLSFTYVVPNNGYFQWDIPEDWLSVTTNLATTWAGAGGTQSGPPQQHNLQPTISVTGASDNFPTTSSIYLRSLTYSGSDSLQIISGITNFVSGESYHAQTITLTYTAPIFSGRARNFDTFPGIGVFSMTLDNNNLTSNPVHPAPTAPFFTVVVPASVPEPATGAALLGLVALGGALARRRARS